jgi:hypothetical protein
MVLGEGLGGYYHNLDCLDALGVCVNSTYKKCPHHPGGIVFYKITTDEYIQRCHLCRSWVPVKVGVVVDLEGKYHSPYLLPPFMKREGWKPWYPQENFN